MRISVYLDGMMDHSEPTDLPPGAVVRFQIGGGESAIKGCVAAIAIDAAGAADEGHSVATISLRGLCGSCDILLTLPRGAAVPLRVGESIEACMRSRVHGIHPVTDLWIRSGDELRLVSSETGDPGLAPGWQIGPPALENPPPPNDSGIANWVAMPVIFRRGSCVGAAKGNLWRRLETAQGAWWICGHAVSWGPGFLPPDGGSYFSYAMILDL